MKHLISTSFLLSAVLAFTISADAEVRLPRLLSSHAVLQRERPIRLWGWGAPGESVQVKLHKQQVSTKTDPFGHWEAALAPEAAGGPYELEVRGSNTIKLEDILIGEVFIASGQSNMGYSLTGIGESVIPHAKEIIASANHPNLRLLHVPKITATYPQQDQPAAWERCTPEAAAPFSALGYLFGLDISEREHIPVGVIEAAYGGTPVEGWISLDTLAASPQLLPAIGYWSALANNQGEVPTTNTRKVAGPEGAAAVHLRYPNLDAWRPAALYNAMIAPLVNYTIKGVIWYQGESSSQIELAGLYAHSFPALIGDWREKWGQGDFPFIYVQISSYKAAMRTSWGTVRDAQRRTLSVANTAMVVSLDVGDPNNVHPSDKRTVADRLLLAARGLVYGEKVEYSGPLFRQVTKEGGAMRVWFDHATGLHTKEEEVKGFEIAGADHNFVPAAAQIAGETVLVRSSQVREPRYVRYAWASATDANLYNAADLPASTFTTVPLRPEAARP